MFANPAPIVLSVLLAPAVAVAQGDKFEATSIARKYARAIILKHYDGGSRAETRVLDAAKSRDGKRWQINVAMQWDGVLRDKKYATRGWLEVGPTGWKWKEEWTNQAVRTWRIEKKVLTAALRGLKTMSEKKKAAPRRATPVRPRRSNPTARRSKPKPRAIRLSPEPSSKWTGWAARPDVVVGAARLRLIHRHFDAGDRPALFPDRTRLLAMTRSLRSNRSLRPESSGLGMYWRSLTPGKGVLLKMHDALTNSYGAMVVWCSSSRNLWTSEVRSGRFTSWSLLKKSRSTSPWRWGNVTGRFRVRGNDKQPGRVDWFYVVAKDAKPRAKPTAKRRPLLTRLSTDELAKLGKKLGITATRSRIVSRPSFYPGMRLTRLTSVKPVATHYVLHDASRVVRLDLKNAQIYKLNKELPIRLSRANVRDYVRFFVANVGGRHGRFQLIERPSDLRWLSKASPETRKAVASVVRPLKLRPKAKTGIYVADAYMVLKDTLFKAKITVRSTGRIAFDNERLIFQRLALQPDRPDRR